MSEPATRDFPEELQHLYARLNRQEVEEFFAGYQLWQARQRMAILQAQIEGLQRQIADNAERMRQVQPAPEALQALTALREYGVSDLALLDRLLDRGVDWLLATLRHLDYCRRVGLFDGDCTRWCENALEGAYDWIDSIQEGLAPEEDASAASLPGEESTAEPQLTEEEFLRRLVREEGDTQAQLAAVRIAAANVPESQEPDVAVCPPSEVVPLVSEMPEDGVGTASAPAGLELYEYGQSEKADPGSVGWAPGAEGDALVLYPASDERVRLSGPLSQEAPSEVLVAPLVADLPNDQLTQAGEGMVLYEFADPTGSVAEVKGSEEQVLLPEEATLLSEARIALAEPSDPEEVVSSPPLAREETPLREASVVLSPDVAQACSTEGSVSLPPDGETTSTPGRAVEDEERALGLSAMTALSPVASPKQDADRHECALPSASSEREDEGMTHATLEAGHATQQSEEETLSRESAIPALASDTETGGEGSPPEGRQELQRSEVETAPSDDADQKPTQGPGAPEPRFWRRLFGRRS
jgi:hypothetical protein